VKGYFYARSHKPVTHQKGPGIIAFSIPDLGITYRYALRATPSELPYKALKALLNFLESNRKVWQGQKLELCTDCAPMIYQVLGDMAAPTPGLPFTGWPKTKTGHARTSFCSPSLSPRST